MDNAAELELSTDDLEKMASPELVALMQKHIQLADGGDVRSQALHDRIFAILMDRPLQSISPDAPSDAELLAMADWLMGEVDEPPGVH